MYKFICSFRQLSNCIRVLIFILLFSDCYCQNNTLVDNSNYYYSQDTVGSEGLTELVLEHGYMINNKKIGLWIGNYTDSCNFFSATMYTGNENYDVKPSILPILVMADYSDQKIVIIRDSKFNFVYSYSCDSVGRTTSRYFENADSTIVLGYHKNGELSFYTHSDYKVKTECHYDESGKLTNRYMLPEFSELCNSLAERKQFITKGKRKNNLPNGIWKTYKNSKLIKIEKYKNGVLLSIKIIY